MGNGLFGKYAFWAGDKYFGRVCIDDMPARALFEDLGFLRGWGVFEALEAKRETLFHPEEHFERLAFSMKEGNLHYPGIIENFHGTFEEFLHSAAVEILKWNGFEKSLVKIIATGGGTNDGFRPMGQGSIFILNQKFEEPVFAGANGFRLKTLLNGRELACVKTLNYFLAESCSFDLSEKGYDDVLYCQNGNILECSRANIFTVTGNRIKTPKDGILEGVTRKLIIQTARDLGLPVEEDNLTAEEMFSSDGVFITCTTKGVWPVVKIDEKIFFSGLSVTLALRQAFIQYKRNYYNRN